MGYDAGTATLSVTPSFLNIEALLAKGARAIAKGLDKELGGQLGSAMAKAAGKAEQSSDRAGKRLGAIFAERALKQIETALSSIPDSDQVLKPLRKELEALARIDLGKGFDEKDFLRRVEAAYKGLKRAQQDAQGPNAVSRFNNAGNAAVALGSVQELVRMARQRGFEAGDAFTNAYQQRLKNMRAALPDVKVDASSSPDERRAAALRQRIEAAQKVKIGDLATRDNNPLNLKVGVKVSADDLKREMATIEGLLDQFAEQAGQIELGFAADKARAQAGAFFDDIKTSAERAAESEAQAWLKSWEEAQKENFRRQKKIQADFASAYLDAQKENLRRQKKIQADFDKVFLDAQKENFRRQQKAQADFAKLYDDAVKENFKRQKKAAEDIATAHREALVEDAARAKTALGNSASAKAQAGTRSAVGAIQDIPVKLQVQPAEIEIAKIRKKLDDLGKKTIGINITTNDFATQVEAEFKKLQKLAKDKKARIDVRTDAAKAASELGAVLVMLKRIDGKRAEVKVDTDSANAGLIKMLGNLSLSLGRLGALIAVGSSLGTAMVPAAAAVASAIGAIGTAALAAGAGIGVMILGFSGIGEAVGLMNKAAQGQAKNTKSMNSSANQVAGAQDQIKSAEMALANTRRNNAQAALRAQREIKDALQDQRDTVREVQRANQDAVLAYRDAQRDAARADIDAQRAQLELTGAYREARKAIDDLNSAVRGNALDQRQAALDIAEAKLKLDKVLANPRATQAEREQADITYQQRLLQMDDLKHKAAELGREQEKRFAVGIKGSEEVKKAEQAVADAGERQLEAQRDLRRAEQDAALERIAGQRKIAKAQRDVSDAQVAAADQQADAAYSVFSATQSVAAAFRSASNAATGASVAGGAALDNLKNKLADMTPAGREFATFLFGLKDAFWALKAAADPVLRGVQEAMESLLGKTSSEATVRLQPLFDFIGRVAAELGQIFIRFAGTLQSPAFQRFFSYIAQTAVPTLNLLSQVTENLLVGFLNLFLGFTPLTDDVNKGFLGLTESFRKWSEGLQSNTGFQQFVGYLRQSGPEVMAFLGQFIKVIGKIVVAAAPMGEVVVNVFTKLFELINKIPASTLSLLVSGIAAAAGAIALFGLATSVASLSVAGLVAGLVGLLIVALGVLVAKSDGLRAALATAWDVIKTAAMSAWDVIWPVLKQLGQLFVDLWKLAIPVFKQLGGMFVWLWQNAILPAGKGIWEVIQTVWEVIQPIFEAIVAIIKPIATAFWWLLRYVIIPVVGGIVYALVKILTPVIKFLWYFIIKPLLWAIGIAFKVVAAIVKVVVGLVLVQLKIMGAIFKWLYEHAIKPVWDRLVKNVFRPLADWWNKEIAPSWNKGMKVLADIWDRFRKNLAVPIKFIVETLLNDGLLKGYNWLADKFGIEPKNVKIPAPKGGWKFASGGAVAGPGTGTSDSITARLSHGEHVLTAREVRAAGGHDVIYALRRALLNGSLFPGYARGGAVSGRGGTGDGFGDWLKKLGKSAKDKATDIFTGVGDFLKDPLGSIKKVAEALLAKVPGKDTWIVQKVLSVPAKIIEALKEKVTGLFSGGGQDGAGNGVFGTTNALGGSGGMIQILRSIFPGLSLNSGFRPGAITATGNRSYHSANRAVDVPPRMDVFEWIRANYPNSRELIFSPAGARQVWNGKPHVYGGVTKQMHYSHVHWAYDKGGELPDTRRMPGGVMQVFHGRRTPDKVLTDNQWQSMATLADKARASMRGGDTYNFPYRNSTLDADELNRWSSRRDALNRLARENY